MRTGQDAPTLALTLRVLARLISYPDATLRGYLPEMRDALHAEGALSAARIAALDALVDNLANGNGLEAEAAYVDLFDRGRRTALHLFEHVHGDSRDRGPAMIDLIKTYEEAGLAMTSNELPDHLTVVLEFASTQPDEQAVAFLQEITHLLQSIHGALDERKSAYASVLAALLELSGQAPKAVELGEEPALDESWSEPVVFGGCATDGQSAHSNQPQPIKIVRTPRAAGNDLHAQGA
ncbi:nitrate reductase molybdenum cofactor assembly chaperone [Trinickia caryophylli]|uniref:Respiratory nitrate reductase chaperone NarJ n=1 Tax=Trinickia caryophylli TaxID=28094 RepID=A0A1X7ELJ9_TRICW|nr:nitrate reductase molybdenum cofactor assembly chaperone [Trinickia caryophylli]PMS08858.1 nitrate reductase molybdenum cofactor assembly chaperone [Trinickia caryophylli]TRX18796.1 nitrate reductase molybdenum cofactor assembly chaperone [Trinickia caryophylli]WQE10406.1 nitrate reductase molybdenum cofactor assembly chaperone [Trinickia caryophylli]SMF35914.1 respiratory nitrate reductase chaperone NarJ [Trinickia caryophylli]GLU32752.1 nitrate reductase molybdenum cofactor assembly chape